MAKQRRFLRSSKTRWLCVLMLSAAVSGECANHRQDATMPLLSYQKTSDSPVFEAGASGLRFALRGERADGSGAPVLHGAFSIGAKHHFLYGGQLMAAIRIVAIDQASGQVFSAFPTAPDTNPVRMPEGDEPSPEMAARLPARVSGHFNVNLRALLKLPDSEGDYMVFLWLDELLAPPQTFHLAGPERSGPGLPAAGGIGLRAEPDAVGGQALTLTRVGDRITVARPPGGRGHMTVMTHAHRSHVFAWRGAALAPADHNGGSFKLDQLLPAPARSEKIFVVVALGETLSDVLVVPRP
jgi:hypothetical protein